MNTLTESAPESTSSARNATAKLVVSPRAMVPTPNSATAASSVRPTRRLTGRTASHSVTAPAPIPIAARNQPSPTAPTPRRSSAMAGSRATAPPKSTAKRSREIAPRRMGWLRTKRSPPTASRRLGRSRSTVPGATWRGCTRRTTTAATSTNIAAAAKGNQISTT